VTQNSNLKDKKGLTDEDYRIRFEEAAKKFEASKSKIHSHGDSQNAKVMNGKHPTLTDEQF
jgi:hypothetical protein